MGPSYWMKIALRALAVFAVGFIVFGVVRQASNVGRSVAQSVALWTDSLENGSGPVELRVPFVTLHVDGEAIGKLETLVVQRHMPGTVDGFRISVKPREGVNVPELAECNFRLRGLDGIELDEFDRLIRCATDSAGLVRFGEVVFVGHDMEAPLFVSPFDLADAPWARGSSPAADPDVSGVSVSVGGEPKVRVEIRDQERVRIVVDSAP